ncbi:MAG: GFA family protein [Pseudomonadota bacterium]
MSITGGCQCGAVRYTAGEILGTARCHCTDCQKQSASAFGLSVYVPTEGFEITGPTTRYESTADSGKTVARVFCTRCGVRIAHLKLPENEADYISLKGGTLDDVALATPAVEIWTKSKLPWIALIDDIPHFQEQPPSFEHVTAAFHAQRTRAVYDARADFYHDNYSRYEPDADLSAFMARVPEGGKVLDLGAGPGNSAAMFAAAGFIAHATDASAEMVRIAQTQTGVTAWQSTYAELHAVAEYDAIWANFALLHAPRAEMPAHLSRIHRALKPQGLLHLGMKVGEGEGPDSLGRFYCYYQPEELQALLDTAGFTLVARRDGQMDGMVDAAEPFVILTAHA